MSLGYAKGQQIENGLRNLNVMNLESNGPTGFFRAIGFFFEWHSQQKFSSSLSFLNRLKKGTKMADPNMESSLKPD